MPDITLEEASKKLASAYEKLDIQRKQLSYSRFRSLLSDTQNYTIIDSYLEAHPETEERVLIALWKFKDGITFKKIRALSGLTQDKFSEKYTISKRTIQEREHKNETERKIPEWALFESLFAVLSDYAES